MVKNLHYYKPIWYLNLFYVISGGIYIQHVCCICLFFYTLPFYLINDRWFLKELLIFKWISFLWILYCKEICVIFNSIIFYGSEPLAFGAEASDSVLTGDDVTSPALISPTLLQFGNGLLDGFNEVYVSKFRTKCLHHVNM